MVLIQEQCGRRLLCAPFFATACVAATLLVHVADESARVRFLPALAEGRVRWGAAFPSVCDWRATAGVLHSRRGKGSWLLDGHAPRVLDGVSAERLLLFAQADDGIRLFSIPRAIAGLSAQALPGWDATRRFADVQLHEVQIADDDALGLVDAAACARAESLVRLYLAAEQLGGAQQCLDLAVAYTATRKQFGRTIASFQAVKHRCAEMMVRIEALRSAVYGAAALAAQDCDPQELELECAAARALASDTYFFCAQEAIQLHGGVGFTWEYDPQLHFKRAQVASHWLGRADALRERIASSLLDVAA
jgi:acyl-CoA dehydrogenase